MFSRLSISTNQIVAMTRPAYFFLLCCCCLLLSLPANSWQRTASTVGPGCKTTKLRAYNRTCCKPAAPAAPAAVFIVFSVCVCCICLCCGVVTVRLDYSLWCDRGKCLEKLPLGDDEKFVNSGVKYKFLICLLL